MGGVKVTIALPVYDTVKSKTVESLVGVVKRSWFPINFQIVSGTILAEALNALANIAITSASTHIFFMDADVQFADDTLDRLLAHDKDVVAAPYLARTPPHEWCVFDGIRRMTTLPVSLTKVDGIGTGCMLVKTGVFSLLPRPWFKNLLAEEKGVRVSEDIWFCIKCQQAGIDVWCDPTIKVGHVVEAVYG